MVDPSVCPPRADVELADVVRRFGPQYTSQHGHRMMPSQKRRGHFRTSPPAALESWEDDSTAVTIATTRSGTTTAAVIGRALNAMEARPGSGSKSVKPSCCRATIFTPS
jgi:hypothetical protein